MVPSLHILNVAWNFKSRLICGSAFDRVDGLISEPVGDRIFSTAYSVYPITAYAWGL
jgi:hypothetical protein